MSSINQSLPTKGKEVCWNEEQGLWLNIVVKEENEEAAVTVKGDDEVFSVKEEEEDADFGGKEEEISVILKEEEEETECPTNVRGTPDLEEPETD
ncbi:hypothetical protein UPYG_G00058830 [Umbra pygmaea]|uniref:Uncharacterized protein n=1 Tax=Umbra pygmaea TaxID=75934 RepID=A0ABD0X8V3_UMBPY